MRKIIYSIIFIPLFCMAFSMNVKAVGESLENENGNGYRYVTHINYAAGNATYTADIYTNNRVFLYADTNGNQSYYYYYCAGELAENNRVGTLDITANNQNFNIQNNGIVGSGKIVTSNNGGIPTWNWTALINRTLHSTFNPDMPVFDNLEEGLEYSVSRDIDFTWSNVKYDISVPTPKIDITLLSPKNTFDTGDFVMSGQLGPEIPYFMGVRASEAYENYYMYVDLTIWTPTSGKISASNGIYLFEPSTLVKIPEFVYYDWSDLTPAPTTSNWFHTLNPDFHNSTSWKHDIINRWYNVRGQIENGGGESYGVTYEGMTYDTTLTGATRSDAIQQTNELLRNAAVSGNRVRIRACFYYIDSNDVIRCGNFATWTSSQPSTTSTQQYSDYISMEGQQANGASQNVSVSTAEQQNDNNSNIPPINISTGSSNITVTVNNGEQAVPNNQNYPTVVSYNHDNIFTQFIGTYTNASQYLGGFAAFCNGVLLWIPQEIWAIVGMGFAMALVIMMIKII